MQICSGRYRVCRLGELVSRRRSAQVALRAFIIQRQMALGPLLYELEHAIKSRLVREVFSDDGLLTSLPFYVPLVKHNYCIAATENNVY